MPVPDEEITEDMSNALVNNYKYMKDAFTDHPRKVRMNYCSHFMESGLMSLYMAKSAIILGIHAVFPFLLKDAHVVRQIHSEQKAPLWHN